MKKQNLVTLLKKLRNEVLGFDEISTSLSELDGLKLKLISGIGFEGYEKLTANLENHLYTVEYTGIISTAINTFLSEEYLEYIYRSSILKNFKKEIELRKKNKIPGYQELLFLNQKNINYDEVEKAFIPITKIFKEKIKKIKQH